MVLAFSLMIAPASAMESTANAANAAKIQLLTQLIETLKTLLAQLQAKQAGTEHATSDEKDNVVVSANYSVYSTTIGEGVLKRYGDDEIPDQEVTVRVAAENIQISGQSAVRVDMTLYEKLSTEAGGDGTWKETEYSVSKEIMVSSEDGTTPFTVDVPGGMTEKTLAEYKVKVVIDPENQFSESAKSDNTAWTDVWKSYHYAE